MVQKVIRKQLFFAVNLSIYKITFSTVLIYSGNFDYTIFISTLVLLYFLSTMVRSVLSTVVWLMVWCRRWIRVHWRITVLTHSILSMILSNRSRRMHVRRIWWDSVWVISWRRRVLIELWSEWWRISKLSNAVSTSFRSNRRSTMLFLSNCFQLSHQGRFFIRNWVIYSVFWLLGRRYISWKACCDGSCDGGCHQLGTIVQQ